MRGEYSTRELSELLGVTQRAVNKRARAEQWAFREQANPNGGGVQKLYLAESFAAKTREQLSQKELEKVLGGENGTACPIRHPVHAGGSQTTIQKYSAGGNGNGSGAVARSTPSSDGRVIVPKRADDVGLAKYRLVMKWREAVATQGHGGKGAATQAFLLAYQSGRLLPGVYETLGVVSEKTLYRLDKQLRDSATENGGHEDYREVADGRGGWRKHGTTKWRQRDLSRDAEEAFLGCYLDPKKPTVKMAVHACNIILKAKGMEPAEDWTLRRWLHEYERRHWHVVVLAREGMKAYKDEVGPYITRDAGSLTVGQVLVADGHDLNFTILHPQTGKPCRMKLIVFYDWASRMPCGWQIMPTESTVAIHAALRNAIIGLGKYPQAVYLDNGKAFKAKVFTESDPDLGELTGIYARLGIATLFADPYNARSKIVERFFLTFGDQLETLVPSYCGSSIEQKPAWLARNEKFHQAWHQARTAGWTPNVREAAYLISLYFDWFAEQPHAGLGGRKPIDVFEEGRGPGIDARELDEQMLWAQPVTPRRCRVTLYGIEYESDCLHGLRPDPKSVIARYDTADVSQIHCYLRESGEYLGAAYPVQALPPIAKLLGDEVGVDQVKQAIKRQRRLAKEAQSVLTEMGVNREQMDSLKALPWNRKVAVLPGGAQGAGSGDAGTRGEGDAGISQAERSRLELVVSRAEEEIAQEAAREAAPDRPEYFHSQVERYEWCFRARHQHGFGLSEADGAFMTYFEAEPEFENYRQRYEDLRELFALQSGQM